MEENVALDSSKQKQFVKSIKGIKKLIKKKPVSIVKPTEAKVAEGVRKKRKYKGRGLVYLSHIPHGFYEHEMTQYFKQFGKVTNARVIRSKKTGNSKGYAFVEFGEPSVAQIVAETMNNYLMGKRLLKANYIPPEKQRKNVFRKNWNQESNPAADYRNKQKKVFNSIKTDEEELKKARRLLKRLNETKKKLKDVGIDYDFFTPVDVPESLVKTEPVEKEDNSTKKISNKKPSVTTTNLSSKNPSVAVKKTKKSKK